MTTLELAYQLALPAVVVLVADVLFGTGTIALAVMLGYVTYRVNRLADETESDV